MMARGSPATQPEGRGRQESSSSEEWLFTLQTLSFQKKKKRASMKKFS